MFSLMGWNCWNTRAFGKIIPPWVSASAYSSPWSKAIRRQGHSNWMREQSEKRRKETDWMIGEKGEEERKRQTKKKKEAQECMEEKKELWASFYIPAPSPFSSNSNNCHFVPLWESWRSLPLLSIGRLRCIPLGGSQPIGSQGGRAPIQQVPKNVSAIDLFPGWPLLSLAPPQPLCTPPHSLVLSLCSLPLSLLPQCLLFFYSFPLTPSSPSLPAVCSSLFLLSLSVLQLVVLSVECRVFGGRSRGREGGLGGVCLWEPAQYP